MTVAPVIGLALVAFLLAGCQPLTLAQAQANCTQKGGLLTVIYKQEITRMSAGPVVAIPGDCILGESFGVPAAPASHKAPGAISD
jgi:hypothetical protein